MQNWVELDFADGTYRFRLGLAQINEIESKCGAGIGEVFARVIQGSYDSGEQDLALPQKAAFFAKDLVEVIRQGLIGGDGGVVDGADVAMSSSVVKRLLDNYVSERPLMELWNVARSILWACMVGFEPPKKDEPASKRAVTETATEG